MRRLLLLILILLPAAAVFAQDSAQPALQRQSWDVFIRRNTVSPLLTDLIFLHLLTGDQSTISAFGERFTLTESGVIFYALDEEKVKLAKADGIIRDHPFINVTSGTHRVDWVASKDKGQIAWTISRKVGDGQLITAVWLADVAGAEIRELLVYGPRAGIQLLPVAFGADDAELFMEVYADGSEGLSPYARRAGLFALRIDEGGVVTGSLPGDQTCFCPVGFGAGSMLRLAPSPELNGLDVEVFGLDDGESQVIPALSRGNYRDAGNILVSADGALAVYALSQVRHFASEQEEIRTVLVLVDLENGRQRIASGPMPDLARPISFTDENRAVLVALERSDGTLKIDLEDGQMIEVAAATYLGRLGER
ncbi:MAG: hypothetical protein OXN88_05710 [Chloroflexota bacterium]|nr:hypothetical protein [Chloroflexota bacterium]